MPTYEYRCPKGHEFELFQRMSDEPKADCPQCGAEATRLLSSGAGFLFKGEGFYITDYRSADYRNAAKSEGKEGGEVTGKDDSAVEPSSGGEGKKTAAKESVSPPDPPSTGSPKKEGGASSTPS